MRLSKVNDEIIAFFPMSTVTSFMISPTLKLAHKGILMVALPVLIQACVYVEMKRQFNQSQEHARELDLRRDVVSRVTDAFMYSMLGFDAMVQLKMRGVPGKRADYRRYISDLKNKTTELADEVQNQLGRRERAATIRSVSKEYIAAFQSLQMTHDDKSSISTVFEDLESNVRFRNAAVAFTNEMMHLSQEMKVLVDEATAQELSYRRNVQKLSDLTFVLSGIVAIILASLFWQGTIKRLNVLKENTLRFTAQEKLIEPLGRGDELGDLDHVFHEMADSLNSARQKESEMSELLSRSKERLELLINNMPIALLVTDEGGLLRAVNPAALELFHYQESDIIEKPVEKLFWQPKNEQPFFQFLTGSNRGTALKLEGKNSDQEAIPVEVWITQFDSAEGRRILITVSDVTERFKLEKLKNDFYTMVSHDLRTPLSGIYGILQLATTGGYGDLPGKLSDKLLLARTNSERLLQMVGRLLLLEKLEEGELDLQVKSHSLSALVDSARKLVEGEFERKSITLEPGALDFNVACDFEYIVQVLANLFANAAKHSPEAGKISIEAECAGDPEGNCKMIRVSVRDQGKGVSINERARIFERFQKGKESELAKDGFGLGLAICRLLIEKHGGKIWLAQQAPDCGACFQFTLKTG